MMQMISLLPGSAAAGMNGVNLASLFGADPIFEQLYSSTGATTLLPFPSTSFYPTTFMKDSFSLASTSSGSVERPTSPEDIKNVVGQMKLPSAHLSIKTSGKLCHVCMSANAAPHYGGIVCGGCKIFFARAVQKKTYYVCDKNGDCRMPPGKRSKCRSCRFQRCLKAKMCPEEVGKLREMKMPDSFLIPKEEGSVVHYFDKGALAASVADDKMRLEKVISSQFPGSFQIRFIAERFSNVERSCDNDSLSFPAPEKYTCSLNVSMADALRNPLSVCERTPISWYHQKANKSGTVDQFKKSYCRLVMHYLEWLGAVDDLYQLMERQRLSLVSNRVCPMVLLTMAYNTYKYKSDGLLLCNGYSLQTENLEDRTFPPLNYLLSGLQTEVIDKMTALELTEEEYSLLKLVNLFSISTPMVCEDSSTTVRTLRLKYEHFLIRLVQDQRPSCHREKIISRVSEMIQIVCALSSLAEIPSTVFISMVVFNLADMQGQLTYDMHIRSYE